MTYTIAVCTVKKKTPDDGQRNCPKHVEFCSKNKFEKLMHLVGFIRIYHDARSPENHISTTFYNLCFLSNSRAFRLASDERQSNVAIFDVLKRLF